MGPGIKKEKSCCSTSGKSLKQRIRILYSDPDATDCSDNEEGSSRFCFVRKDVNGVKRMVTEVCISDCGENSSRGSGSAGTSASKTTRVKPKTDGLTEQQASLPKRSSSIYRGVRKRKWGKFAAEIRNPFLGNRREWLGTYDTELEAHYVYENRKREIDSLLDLEKRKKPSAAAAVKSVAGTSAVCALAATATSNVHPPVLLQPSASAVATSEDDNVNAMGDLPSPSSVLDMSDANPVRNDSTVVIKFEDDQNVGVNRQTTSTSESELDPYFSSGNNVSFFGAGFDYLFDEIKAEDLPMCDLSSFGLSDLPNFDLDITNTDLNFIDDLLDMTGSSEYTSGDL